MPQRRWKDTRRNWIGTAQTRVWKRMKKRTRREGEQRKIQEKLDFTQNLNYRQTQKLDKQGNLVTRKENEDKEIEMGNHEQGRNRKLEHSSKNSQMRKEVAENI